MRKTALILILLFGFTNCTSDDVANPRLNQKWILNNVTCFCFYADDFDFSTHTLTFNSQDKMVVIENSENNQFIRAAGTYPYSDNGKVIEIDGGQFTYEIKGNTLVLTFVDDPSIADDEVAFFYTKG